MERILNLTQHKPTPEQVASGVFDADDVHKSEIVKLLTFEDIPADHELHSRAEELAAIAKDICGVSVRKVMIGGALFFMSALEVALMRVGIIPVYAFSLREAVEVMDEQGTVTKSMKFKHLGFVEKTVPVTLKASRLGALAKKRWTENQE